MATKYTKGLKIDQMAIKYVYQFLPLQEPPKFTQSGILGLKIYAIWQPRSQAGCS
jgi:hypothetical protein